MSKPATSENDVVGGDEVLVMNFSDDEENFPTPMQIKEEYSDNSCANADPISDIIVVENGIKLEPGAMCIEDTKENIFKEFDLATSTHEEEYILGADASLDILAIARNTKLDDGASIEVQNQPDPDVIVLDSDSDDDSVSLSNSTCAKSLTQNILLNNQNSDEACSRVSEENSSQSISSLIITNVKSVVESSENMSSCQIEETLIDECLKSNDSDLILKNKVLQNSLPEKDLNGPKQIFKCETCDFSAKTRFSLSRHTNLHRSTSIKVGQESTSDNKVVGESTVRSQPKDLNTLKTNIFKCKFCSFASKIRFALQRHVLTHTKKPERSVDQKHRESSDINTIKCKYCSYVAKNHVGLISHTRFRHPKKIKVECLLCYKIVKKHKIKEHQLTCSKINKQRIKAGYSASTAVKIVKATIKTANVTSKKIRSTGSDSKNDLIATGKDCKSVQPLPKYKCDYCSYTSEFDLAWKRHLPLHTKFNQPIYSCKECDYKSTRFALFKHEKSAHGDANISKKNGKHNRTIIEAKTIAKKRVKELQGAKATTKIIVPKAKINPVKRDKPNLKITKRIGTNNEKLKTSDKKKESREIINLKIKPKEDDVKPNNVNKHLVVLSNTEIGDKSRENEVKSLLNSKGTNKLLLKEDKFQLSKKQENALSVFDLNTFLYVCEICDYVTNQKETLISHKLIHTVSNLATDEKKAKPLDLKCTMENAGEFTNSMAPKSEKEILQNKIKPSFNEQDRKYILLKDNKRQCSLCKRILVNAAAFTNHRCENLSEFYKLVKREGGRFTCKECGFSAITRLRVKQHLLVHKTFEEAAVYKCLICDFRTKYKAYLVIHMSSKHGKQDAEKDCKYNCDMCNFKTNDHRVIRSHKISCHKEPITCDVCGFTTIFTIVMSDHKKSAHNLQENKDEKGDETSNEIKYKCDNCDFETNYKDNLQNHKVLHININEFRVYKNRTYNVKLNKDTSKKFSNREETCSSNSAQQTTKSTLNNNVKKHKSEDNGNNFLCNLCSYSTTTRDNLDKHEYLHQCKQKGQIYKCDVCKYKTPVRAYLSLHKKIHDTSQIYYCDYCEYSSNVKVNLSKHNSAHHVKSASPNTSRISSKSCVQFTCKYCIYTTKFRIMLKKHLEKKHSEKIKKTNKTVKLSKNRQVSNMALFECGTCSYASIYKYSVERHKRRHHNTVNLDKGITFKCSSCSFVSQYKHSLERHKRRHHNTVNLDKGITFKCSSCSFVSQYKHSLERHKRRHHNTVNLDKGITFKCSSCSFVSQHKHSVERHKRRHHNTVNLDKGLTFKCSSCSFVSQFKRGLQIHVYKKHIENKNDSKPSVFKCSSCFYMAKHRHNLDKHFNTCHVEKTGNDNKNNRSS